MELWGGFVIICRWNRKLCKNNDHQWLFHCNNMQPNSFLGTRQMLMYEKTWVIPILNLHWAHNVETMSIQSLGNTSATFQGISEPEFYGDLVYIFRKNIGKSNFSEQFRKLINRYERIGCSLDIMRQTACLVVNPNIVDGYASLFNCTTAVRVSDSMTASS